MNGLEKKLQENNAKSSYIINMADYDENAKYLIGWPGYRTSHNKSGLGYIETQAEWAHMRGLMFRWLITGKFKTRNLFYLSAMTLYGILGASPVLLLFASENEKRGFIQNLYFFVPTVLIGILLLVNVMLSLIRWNKGGSITGD